MRRSRWQVVAVIAVTIAAPAPPAHTSATGATSRGRAAEAVQCRNGKAEAFPCSGIDLLSLVDVEEMGGVSVNDVWGWADPETKKEYALVGSSAGLQIVDVSNPTAPTYLGVMPKGDTAAIWQDVEVYEDHAFVVCDQWPCGMQILDLTRLREPPPLPQVYLPDVVFPLTRTTHTIDINQETGFAYLNGSVETGGEPWIVDIQDPKNPVPVAIIQGDGYTHDSHCRIYRGDDKKYRGREICFNANEDSVTIFDVTDKSNIEQLSKATYEGATYTHQAWLTEDHDHILVADELDEQNLGVPSTTYIFDVRNLAKPRQTGAWRAGSRATDHNNYILGDRVFAANYTAGLRILDPAGAAKGRLKELGYFDVVPDSDAPSFDGAWAAYPFLPSGNVLVSGVTQGLFVLKPRL